MIRKYVGFGHPANLQLFAQSCERGVSEQVRVLCKRGGNEQLDWQKPAGNAAMYTAISVKLSSTSSKRKSSAVAPLPSAASVCFLFFGGIEVLEYAPEVWGILRQNFTLKNIESVISSRREITHRIKSVSRRIV
jgi:hypothetical protein